MDILLVVGLSAGLFVALELRLGRRTETEAGDIAPVECGLFSPAFVRRRLAALTEELERLDRDPDAFAKAFHTMAARTAYEALLADASRLADRPPPRPGAVMDAEPVAAAHGIREVIEL
jgi:hypothetical protein